jgi:DNA-binding response OmpR family regulator
MIVDDDVEASRDVAKMLEDNGHTVKVYVTTRNIVARMETLSPDLLILDVMFPDNPVAGFEAARKIRNHKDLRSTPIILLTAVNQEFPSNLSADDIDEAWMPVQDFVEKPIRMSILLERVDRLLKKR